MYFYFDKNIQLTWIKDKLLVETSKGVLLSIQGLASGNTFLSTGLNEKNGSMIDIIIFPKKRVSPPHPTISSRILSFFVWMKHTYRQLTGAL